MKTRYMMLCLLGAISATASAQEGIPGAPPPPAPLPPPGPGAGFKTLEIRGGNRAGHEGRGEVRMEIHSAAPGSGRIHVAEVPTFEEGQLADPISWSYQKGREMWEEPLRTGPVTFLGVSASPPPRELAAHLPIPRDTGLVIEGIVPDSPAAKAGLEQNDVLTKLDDQILIHPRQLSVLVSNRKEGDSVKLSFIRKGEMKEASVVLAMHENKGPSGSSQDMIFKHKDVVIAGDSNAPLRTFVRRFNLPPEAALKQAEAELSVARAKVESALAEGGGIAGTAHKATQAAEQDSQKAEIDEIRRKLDEVLKRLEERK